MPAVPLGYLVSQLGLQCLQLHLAALLLAAERVPQLLQLSPQGGHLLPVLLRCPAQAVPLLFQAGDPGALLRSCLSGHETVVRAVPRVTLLFGDLFMVQAWATSIIPASLAAWQHPCSTDGLTWG